MVGLVVLFVVVAVVDIGYQRQAALGDARHAALASAGFAARTAAREIAADMTAARGQVAAVAGNPAVRRAFTTPAGCTLQFGGAGAFTAGHIDIIASNGTVACSSLAHGRARGYRGAGWLAAAVRAPLFKVPVLDARTGQQTVVAAAPIRGKGAVAAFLDLRPLGPALASTLSGFRHLEFVVTSPDGSTVLARSVRARESVGKPVDGTPFAGAAGGGEHADLDGTPRLYEQAAVAGMGWQVFAGDSTAQAFGAANQLSNREILLTLTGLVVFLLAVLVVYRRITRPITSLSAQLQAATAHPPAKPVTVAGPAEVAALAEDVNQLIAAANSELEARTRLAAIAESSADAIFGLTLSGEVTSWNAGAEQIFGYSRAEIVGNDVSVLTLPDRAAELAAALATVGTGERIWETESQCLRKDNSLVDVSFTFAPVLDATGTVTGAASVVRDVTGRNRAEEARRALEHRLAQSERLESLGQLAGGIAHDFNNLLAVIMNYANFVAEETARQPEVRADAEQILQAAERASRLTRQLLIFGRRQPAQAQPLDINAIVADVRNLLSRSIGTNIKLDIRPEAALPAIEADRGQVEQVLLNLAINARDAMPGGGTLTIETRATVLDEEHARARAGVRAGHYVELAVRDTGTGMSPDVVAHIFEPYFTTKAPGKGTGLGLATVYGIVTAAGGAMAVESREGTGTTFRLYFPVTGHAAAPEPDTGAPQGMGAGETILVVDDEPAVLAATVRMLRQNGYATLAAGTFDQALHLATGHAFQLLLTDSLLPERSGPALADRIAKLRPGVAVLFMSGQTPPESSPGRAGGPPSIAKPFTQQALLRAVQTALAVPPPAPPTT